MFALRHQWLAALALVALAGACRRAEPDALAAVAETSADSTIPADTVVRAEGSAAADTVVVEVSDTDTIITISNQSWWRPGPLNEHIGNDDGDGYGTTVLDRRRGADGRLYLLVRSVSPSRSDPTIGYCGSGEEVYINWLAADSAMQVVRVAAVLVESCLMGHELADDSVQTRGEPWRLRFRMQGDTLGTVEYDRRRPERGIRLAQVRDTTWWLR